MQEPKIPGGYILLSRKLIESEIWDKPPLYIKIWVYLLNKAQHGDFKGLKRGQLRTSIPEIMEDCSWYVGYRKVKPTKDQVFQVIDWLRKSHEHPYESNNSSTMITTTKATQGLLVNIDNYNVYQDPKNYESNGERDSENDTKATRKQQRSDNINKNDKNVKNEQEKDYTSKIKDLLPVFSSIPDFNKLNKQYWDVIRETRTHGKVAHSVIFKNMEKWQKYDPIVIEYALKEHVKSHAGKKEEYTIGIMRRTSKEEAEERLNNNVGLTFKKKGNVIDWDSVMREVRNEEIRSG